MSKPAPPPNHTAPPAEPGWGPGLHHSGAAPKTLTEATLARLRRDILAGALPPGARIKGQDLKHRYGVGASPVREALFQLVAEGLVQVDGQRGFRVASVSAGELADITHWRVQLECQALRLSIRNGGAGWAAAVTTALAALTSAERQAPGQDMTEAAELWEGRHRSFHFALYQACGSPWLLSFCQTLIAQSERYRRRFVLYASIDPHIPQEHASIAESALAGRHEAACATLERHIGRASELAQEHLQNWP